jgi:hypothetical protein
MITLQLIINTYVSLLYELEKNIGKLVTRKFVETGPSFYKKKITGPRAHKGWETLS